MSVKILAFPIFRKYWLYHSWSDAAAEAAKSALVKDWRKGVNLEEKLNLLGKQVSSKVSSKQRSQHVLQNFFNARRV